MSRETAIQMAHETYDNGRYLAALDKLIASPSESQKPDNNAALRSYLDQSLRPHLEPLFDQIEIFDLADAGPVLLATRTENPALPTVLSYGHGDTVLGQEGSWEAGRDPFRATLDGERIYGRGSADNKGQHLINLIALESVLKARGRLGFNLKFVVETSEEIGSPGLNALFENNREAFGADVLIGSDGMRLRPDTPTLVMGTRGVAEFTLTCAPREGAHHSGNFGGLLKDPAIRLVHALATITDARGQIAIPDWRPDSLTPDIRKAIADCPLDNSGPAIDMDWGEADLTPGERVWGWNSFAVLAMKSGIPEAPMGAIAPSAFARCQLRFVVGTNEERILPALREHLAERGFDDIAVTGTGDAKYSATRVSPDNPWVRRVAGSIEASLGSAPAILPNAGGSLPNAMFTRTLGLPTIWIPHSYSGCSQHAPNEHLLVPVVREALGMMAGLFWDLGA